MASYARYLQTVDRAGDIGVPGHVALRDVLTHQARGQRTARVQPRKAVYLTARTQAERDVSVLVARERADKSGKRSPGAGQ